jgi:hypothetical protein
MDYMVLYPEDIILHNRHCENLKSFEIEYI